MARLVTLALTVCLLTISPMDAAAANWPTWLQRAPLNTDTSLVGFQSAMGLASAYRYLADILNLGVLAALLYVLERDVADYSHFLYVYFGILAGGMLLSFALSPLLHAFALLPVVAFTAFLLARFCSLSVRRAALVAVVFHAYQVVYILIFTAITARYA